MHAERLGLPGYEVMDVLGQGGFATVYRARQLAVVREVALKVDNRVLATDRDRQRFMREVTAAGQLSSHPHVAAVYDAGVLRDGRPYMVLELCPGGSLADRLRERGPVPVAEARDIGVRIADALAAAHAAGVLHRDIKPGNIMVNRYGGVALADFGLAAMSRMGHELSVTRESLTPAYAPPEAFRMAEPSPAGDVYSLAATVYALVNGRPPHFPEEGGLSIAEVIVRHSWPLPDLPGVSPAFTDVLRRAMAEDPADRLPSAAALRDALAAVDLGPAASTGPGAFTAPFPNSPATDVLASSHGTFGPPPQYPGGEPAMPPETTSDRGGRRRPWRSVPVLAVAGVFVSVSVTSVVVYVNTPAPRTSVSSPPASGPATSTSTSTPAPAGFRVPTTTTDCPAAAVDGVDGRCTTTAECWGGIVSINGDVSANRSDCLVEHYWETFAIAPLPKDGMTSNQDELKVHPDARALCSRDVLAKSLRGKARDIAPSKWMIEVVPPSQIQFADGLRVFRCLATVTEVSGHKGTYFRPRS